MSWYDLAALSVIDSLGTEGNQENDREVPGCRAQSVRLPAESCRYKESSESITYPRTLLLK